MKSNLPEKIIIVGPAFPLRGGIANFNEALARGLMKQGYDVEIISFSLQYPGFLFPGKSQFEEGRGPEDLKIFTWINSINPFNWFKVAKRIRKKKPELVIVRFWLPFMGPCLGTISRWIKRKGKTKVIAITDNVIPHEKRFGDKIFTRYFVKSCDGFVAMSRSVLEDLSQFTKSNKKRFSPHPIYDIFGDPVSLEESRKKLDLHHDDNLVMFFGFIRKYKGLDLLIKAFGENILKSSEIKLLVAGEFYEDKSPYLNLIKDLGLENRVILHDRYIPSEDVKYYFGASNLVAQTYRTATQSGVTQIAYHFDKPMLVTNVGGLGEIVPHNKGGYVTSQEPKEIANCIIDFFNNNRENEFTEVVKENKEKFSWDNFSNELIDLYREL